MNRQKNILCTKYTVEAPIPRNVTFAFLSDLHCYENDPILDCVRTIDPDAVLVAGDFIHSAHRYADGMEFLRRSAAEYPTFCSVGNHEHLYPGELAADVQETGAVLLDNDAVSFRGISIGGLSSVSLGHSLPAKQEVPRPDCEWLRAFSEGSGYKLLMCHHPEYYEPWIKSLPVDLILSGHAHGGQWRLFGRGLFAPGQGWLPKYTAGLYDGRLLVSRGIGNMAPVPRIGNPPQIISLTIKSP